MKVDYLSNSQVQMALKCGQQYFYRYVEGIKTLPGFAMVRGRSVDSAVSTNLSQKIESKADLPVSDVQALARQELSDQFRKNEIEKDADYAEMDFETAKGKLADEVVGLAALHTTEVSPHLQPAHVQTKVTLQPSRILPVKFVGVLDLIDSNGTIRDTKTAKKSATDSAALESDQLTAYDMLYRAHFKTPPAGLQLDQLVRTEGGKLSANELKAPARERDELFAYVARANAVVSMVEREVYTPAPDSAWWCNQRWCGYWDRCPFARGRKRPTT